MDGLPLSTASKMARARCESFPQWLRYLASPTHAMLFEHRERAEMLAEAAEAAEAAASVIEAMAASRA